MQGIGQLSSSSSSCVCAGAGALKKALILQLLCILHRYARYESRRLSAKALLQLLCFSSLRRLRAALTSLTLQVANSRAHLADGLASSSGGR
jgi:hypothetical protein